METLYLNMLNTISEGVCYINAERRICFWNHAAETITGYRAEELVDKLCNQRNWVHVDVSGRPLCQEECPLFQVLQDGKSRSDKFFVYHKNGEKVPINVNIIAVHQDGEIVGVIESFTQATSNAYMDNLIVQLSEVAMHDALTQLPNRRCLGRFLDYQLEQSRCFGQPLAVLFADVDDFSSVNNTYGHVVGDMVLKAIAETLLKNTRHNDMIGRWGGEELFGIYHITDASECKGIAERFRALVEAVEVEYESKKISVTVSIGITMFQPEDTRQSLVQRVDTLMYQSKQKGKNCISCDCCV